MKILFIFSIVLSMVSCSSSDTSNPELGAADQVFDDSITGLWERDVEDDITQPAEEFVVLEGNGKLSWITYQGNENCYFHEYEIMTKVSDGRYQLEGDTSEVVLEYIIEADDNKLTISVTDVFDSDMDGERNDYVDEMFSRFFGMSPEDFNECL